MPNSGWLFSAAWNPAIPRLVVGSQSGYYLSSDAINYTFTSTGYSMYEVVYAQSINTWVAVSGTNIYSSPDGLTWTLRQTGPGDYRSVSWSPTLGLFAAGGSNTAGTTTRITTSPNGITWSARTTQDQLIYPRWVPGLGVFLGSSYSYNGTTWVRLFANAHRQAPTSLTLLDKRNTSL